MPDDNADDNPAADVVAELADQLATHDIDRVHPEHNLIGALLASPASRAAAILATVRDADIEQLLPRVTLGIIRRLVAQERDPGPMAVAAAARIGDQLDDAAAVLTAEQLAATVPPEIADVPGGGRAVTEYVTKAYTLGIPVHAEDAARQVSADALHRLINEDGTRLAQMGAARIDVDTITAYADTQLTEWKTRAAELNGDPAPSTGHVAATPPITPGTELRIIGTEADARAVVNTLTAAGFVVALRGPYRSRDGRAPRWYADVRNAP